jgi:hypothetical protein
MGLSRYSSDYAPQPSVAILIMYMYIEILKYGMPDYDVANFLTVTKMNMIDDMPCTYGTVRTVPERILHQVTHRAALEVSHRPVARSHLL